VKSSAIVGGSDPRARAVVRDFGVYRPHSGASFVLLSTGIAAEAAELAQERLCLEPLGGGAGRVDERLRLSGVSSGAQHGCERSGSRPGQPGVAGRRRAGPRLQRSRITTVRAL